ncbi:hypothetical protein B0H14DRAFT_3131953 [Mycena olivaceomarginata]|nr:hypothetical protein B0H14DRAFT_3131953 [Mycena olivaceomarginata]
MIRLHWTDNMTTGLQRDDCTLLERLCMCLHSRMRGVMLARSPGGWERTTSKTEAKPTRQQDMAGSSRAYETRSRPCAGSDLSAFKAYPQFYDCGVRVQKHDSQQHIRRAESTTKAADCGRRLSAVPCGMRVQKHGEPAPCVKILHGVTVRGALSFAGGLLVDEHSELLEDGRAYSDRRGKVKKPKADVQEEIDELGGLRMRMRGAGRRVRRGATRADGPTVAAAVQGSPAEIHRVRGCSSARDRPPPPRVRGRRAGAILFLQTFALWADPSASSTAMRPGRRACSVSSAGTRPVSEFRLLLRDVRAPGRPAQLPQPRYFPPRAVYVSTVSPPLPLVGTREGWLMAE